jgi:hypothetical protein
MEGKLNRNDIEREIFKVYDRFFYYARHQIWEKNINCMLPTTVNKNHRSILKFLNFKVCCNKRCSSWIEILPYGVAYCGACKIRKAETRLNCRLSKKIKQIVCNSDNTGSEKDCVCSICIDNIEINKQQIKLRCSHRFHPDCISQWTTRKTSCPCCRKEILRATYFSDIIYL